MAGAQGARREGLGGPPSSAPGPGGGARGPRGLTSSGKSPDAAGSPHARFWAVHGVSGATEGQRFPVSSSRSPRGSWGAHSLPGVTLLRAPGTGFQAHGKVTIVKAHPLPTPGTLPHPRDASLFPGTLPCPRDPSLSPKGGQGWETGQQLSCSSPLAHSPWGRHMETIQTQPRVFLGGSGPKDVYCQPQAGRCPGMTGGLSLGGRAPRCLAPALCGPPILELLERHSGGREMLGPAHRVSGAFSICLIFRKTPRLPPLRPGGLCPWKLPSGVCSSHLPALSRGAARPLPRPPCPVSPQGLLGASSSRRHVVGRDTRPGQAPEGGGGA